MEYAIEYKGPATVELPEPPPESFQLEASFQLTKVTEPEPPVAPPIEPPPITVPPVQPATLIIDPTWSNAKIQSQLDRAVKGDVYDFQKGEYPVQLVISKPGVTLRGPEAVFIHPGTNAAGCFRILSSAVTLEGMSIMAKPGVHVYGLIQVGRTEATALADLPSHITLKNLMMRGDATKGGQRAISFEAVDSIIDGCNIDDVFADTDSQCVWWLNATRVLITRCKLRAAGQCILVGGGASLITGHTSSDITLSKNDFRGRMGKLPDGRPMTSKYVLEFKRGINVKIIENDIHDLLGGVNAGTAIGLTERCERGKNPWLVIENVLIARNRLWNVGRFINALGVDYNSGWIGSFTGLRVEDNVAVMSGPPGNYGAQILCSVNDAKFARNTIVHGLPGSLASCLALESPPPPGGLPPPDYVTTYPCKNLAWGANVLHGNVIGRGCGGATAIRAYAPGGKFQDNIMVVPASMAGNLAKPSEEVYDANYKIRDPYTAFGSGLALLPATQLSYDGDGWRDELLEEYEAALKTLE